MMGSADKKAVTIWSRFGSNRGAYCTASTAAVINNNLLAQLLGQLICQRTGKSISAATSGKGHHKGNGFVGPLLSHYSKRSRANEKERFLQKTD